MQPSLAMCRPVNWADVDIAESTIREVVEAVHAENPSEKPGHDPLLGIYPNSVVRDCSICSVRCWVGPRVLVMVDAGRASVGCYRCVMDLQSKGVNYEMRSLNNPDTARRPSAR